MAWPAEGAAGSGDDGSDEAWSDTEGSESDDGEMAGGEAAVDKILRQLRGAKQHEEIERQPEVQRKTVAVKAKHTFYKDTRVTSVPQEEQSALPAGVVRSSPFNIEVTVIVMPILTCCCWVLLNELR